MRIDIVPLLVLSLLSTSILATSSSAQTGSRPQEGVSADRLSSKSVATEFDDLRRAGDEALYNLDYQTARERYQQMVKLVPDHPAGYIYLANNLWLEILNTNRRLSSSLYSSASFYTQSPSKDNVNPEREGQFNDWINKALEVAEAWSKKDPANTEALYFKARALSMRSAYSITVKRSFGGAMGPGRKAVKYAKEVLKQDPNFIDAYLGIGVYEYMADSLPFLWRQLARLAGVKGSRKAGINHLEQVADRGKYSSDDARVLLIGLYTREDQPELALNLLTDLANRFPGNYLFGIERAATLYRMGHSAEGERAFANLFKDPRIATASQDDVVNYQWGEALLGAGNYTDAIERYKAVIDWPKSEISLASLAHLRVGQAFDALGRHREAVAKYDFVLSLKNVYDSHKLAKMYTKKPYTPVSK